MRWLTLALTFVATSAAANTPTVNSQPTGPVTPLSVWRTDDARTMEHIQSGLVCPETLGAFKRTDTMVFDTYGLDVDCNYAAGGARLTIYLTRLGGADIDAVMADAKAQLVKFGAEKHPQLISETRAAEAGVDWRVALYSEDGGTHTGIWIAELAGWAWEYRATYPAIDEASILSNMKPVTAQVQESAGRRLALCAKSPAPGRAGRPVTDKKALRQAAISTSLFGGSSKMVTKEGMANSVEPAPLTWCVEQAVTHGDLRLLYWRAVDGTGADAEADRITATTVGPPPTLVAVPDSLSNLIDAAAKGGLKNPRWVATLQDKERTLIFGYFDARPTPEALSELMAQILSGKQKALGGYSIKGKDINIIVPPEN